MTKQISYILTFWTFIISGLALVSFALGSLSPDLVHAERLSANSIHRGFLGSPIEGQVPILMYHHVGFTPEHPDSTRVDLTVSPEDFEAQVRYLKAQGYETIHLGDLDKPALIPKKAIVFSFDDGYSDVFENAFPILSKYGYTGSVAVITSFVGTTNGTNVYASWQQIQKARNDGFEIVSHSQTHFDVLNPKVSEEDITRELQASKIDLEKQGINTEVFIYPYGHLTDTEVEVAKKAGYKLGLTTAYGLWDKDKDQLRIPRVRVHGHQDFEKFKLAIVGQLKK